MPKNFFELSDEDSDDDADRRLAERLSLSMRLQPKPKAKPRAKKASVKRASARRGSKRRGSKRRTSRPLVQPVAAAVRPAPAPAARPAHAADLDIVANALNASRNVFATYIDWREAREAGPLFHKFVEVSDAASKASEESYSAAARRRAAGEQEKASLLSAAAVTAAGAAQLGNLCARLAQAGRFPDDAERQKQWELYLSVSKLLQRAYAVLDAKDELVQAQAQVAALPAAARAEKSFGEARAVVNFVMKPLSVQEMREGLEDLEMEERVRGIGLPNQAEPVGEPPVRAPYMAGGGTELATAWTGLLRFVPQTVTQLGIAREVRESTLYQQHLGSGAYATAFALPNPMYVLKLTTDAEDAYISMKLAEASREGRPPVGLIRTYMVFRIKLPFDIRTRMSWDVSTVYGMVTERVLALSDFKSKRATSPLVDRAMETKKIGRQSAFNLMNAAYDEASKIVGQHNLKSYLAIYGSRTQTGRDWLEASEWCASRGLVFGSDAHAGNFAVAWRDGQFCAVKSDLGHNSVLGGKALASKGASRLPLAANKRDRT